MNYTLNDAYARTKPSVSKSLSNTISGSYMFDNRYAFNFSVRGDGSNRFGQDEKEEYFRCGLLGRDGT